jgi:lipopolysaccharide/colanic/teichoic acid biosynthesis glycosyltransferase
MAGNDTRIPSWKRIFDIFLIVITAPVTLPFMIIMAVAVKLVSPGPVFFWQQRVGHGGETFMILKFRSMKVNAPTQTHESHVENLIQSERPMTKMDAAGDSRMIPGGWLMRAAGLDELPQIFNVLKGEMSLVGPRPCTPKEFARYTPEQRKRAEVLPGMTGLWQVKGKNKLTFKQMIELDLQYCKRTSIILDIVIIFTTIPALFCQVMETFFGQARMKATVSATN